MLKKAFFLLAFSIAALSGFAQKNPVLEKRLDEFMKINDLMDLEAVMDYTYPKLFTLVPRETLLEQMKSTFDNDQMSIRFESLKVDSIYPIFKTPEGSYAKVTYSMDLFMKFKENIAEQDQAKKAAKNQQILASMGAQYGASKVSFDEAGNELKIQVTSPMIAALDAVSPKWSFVNYKSDDPMMKDLFSKAVLDKMITYE